MEGCLAHPGKRRRSGADPHVTGRLGWAMIATLGAMTFAACGGDRDAASVEAEVPLLRAEPGLRIGSLEGDDAYVFGFVSGIAVDDAGRILVADMHAHEIRVFDADGTHRFSFARRGAGPGELSQPCCLAFAPDGLLWVRDNGNARYVGFEVGDDTATPVATRRMEHSDANRHVATTFDDAGRLIDIGSRPDPTTGAPQTMHFHLGADGEVAREVAAPLPPDPDALVHRVQVRMGESVGIRFFYQPFGPRHMLAHGPEGMFADVVSSSYEVRWYASDGSLLHTIARPATVGPQLTPEQRARADSLIAANARVAGASMPFDTPQRHPPIAALHFDEAGRLWVQRTTLPGEPRQVDIYARDGALVERVEFPPGLDLSYGVLRPDVLVGVMRDELDVEYVVRLEVR